MKTTDIFITADKLLRLQSQKESQVTLFDCRFMLSVDGADDNAGFELFQKCHIKHAHYLNLNSNLSSAITDQSGRHPLPTLEQWQKLMDNFSISKSSQIVVYDGGKLAFAARAWLLFHHFGYHHVRILEDGFDGKNTSCLIEEKSKTVQSDSRKTNAFHSSESNDDTSPFHTTEQISAVDINIPLVSIDELMKLKQVSCNLIDAREPKRFSGEFEPLDSKAGHIPTAINANWLDCFDSDGRFKNAEWHSERWSKIIPNDAHLTHYCGSGVTAIVNIISAMLAKRTNNSLYLGGWSEYIKTNYFQSVR